MNLNLQIGLKVTQRKDGRAKADIFYCGENGSELRAKHAELVKSNTDGSALFYLVAHPLLTPLQRVQHKTEDHPDQVKAQDHRQQLAEGGKPKSSIAKVPDPALA